MASGSVRSPWMAMMPAAGATFPGLNGHVGAGEALTRFVATGGPEALPADRLAPPIREFLDYWCARRSGAGEPEYSSIDPIDIPSLLPYLMLWTVERNASGLQFVRRLAGGEVGAVRGPRIVGRTLDDLNGHNAARSREEFEFVARTRNLHYVERTADWIDRPFRYYCRLLMPLSRPGSAYGDLVSVLTYDQPREP